MITLAEKLTKQADKLDSSGTKNGFSDDLREAVRHIEALEKLVAMGQRPGSSGSWTVIRNGSDVELTNFRMAGGYKTPLEAIEACQAFVVFARNTRQLSGINEPA